MTTHPHFVRCVIPNELKQAGKKKSLNKQVKRGPASKAYNHNDTFGI